MVSKTKHEDNYLENKTDGRVPSSANANLDRSTSDPKIDKIDRKQKTMRKINSWFDWWAWLG
jgi:hypothetical protein